jgi:hypothetical protein
MRAMKRMCLILIPILVIGGGFIVCAIPCVYLGIGVYDLTVTVSAAEPLNWVYCHPCHERNDAERWFNWSLNAETMQPSEWVKEGDDAIAAPFDGKPITVKNWLYTRDPCLFGKHEVIQRDRYLVVITELRNGRRAGMIIDIPDQAESREISLSLP